MTKVRPPLSQHRALKTIGDHPGVGWARCAQIVGHPVRTVQDWSDPETSAQIRIEHALALDAAYLDAGGGYAPFLAWYAFKLEIDSETLHASANRVELVAKANLEVSQAISAQMIAARPGADDIDCRAADRETDEAIEALTHLRRAPILTTAATEGQSS